MPQKILHLSTTEAEHYYWDAWQDLQRALNEPDVPWHERRDAINRVAEAYDCWHKAICRRDRADGSVVRVSARAHEFLRDHITDCINSRWAVRHD